MMATAILFGLGLVLMLSLTEGALEVLRDWDELEGFGRNFVALPLLLGLGSLGRSQSRSGSPPPTRPTET